MTTDSDARTPETLEAFENSVSCGSRSDLAGALVRSLGTAEAANPSGSRHAPARAGPTDVPRADLDGG